MYQRLVKYVSQMSLMPHTQLLYLTVFSGPSLPVSQMSLSRAHNNHLLHYLSPKSNSNIFSNLISNTHFSQTIFIEWRCSRLGARCRDYKQENHTVSSSPSNSHNIIAHSVCLSPTGLNCCVVRFQCMLTFQTVASTIHLLNLSHSKPFLIIRFS